MNVVCCPKGGYFYTGEGPNASRGQFHLRIFSLFVSLLPKIICTFLSFLRAYLYYTYSNKIFFVGANCN